MSNDTHFFSAKLAGEVGIAGATILHNIARMQVQHEYAGHSPFEYQGRWYVRHSYESLQQWHSYLSIPQLKRIMKQLEDDGYVTKSHLGKPFDRTLYWSVSRAVIDSTESHYASGEIAPSDSTKSHDVQQTNNSKQSARAKKGFSKPDVGQVAEYMVERSVASRSANSEAEKFCDHYDSNGWKVGGKSPMKDWKAAVRNWLRNDFGGKGTKAKPVIDMRGALDD
jgi:hypothetical protein